MNAAIRPVLETAGMSVRYSSEEGILNADSLAGYDVLFVYNAKKGSLTDHTPDLTPAQETSLYDWVEAGHPLIAAHCASSSYLENPRYAELIGGAYTEHGPDLESITLVQPDHPALAGVSPPTGWDEGRVHRMLRQDLTILATANSEKTPWIWIHPQGLGWVYYTSSGHDNRVWSDVKFQGMLVQAIRWGYSTLPTVSSRMTLRNDRIIHLESRWDALGRSFPFQGRRWLYRSQAIPLSGG